MAWYLFPTSGFQGSVTGFCREAFVNFLAFLGWAPKDNREILELDDLIKEFEIERLQKGAAIFNLEKLDWFNKEYIGIDQGPLLLMIENFRTGLVWNYVMKDSVIQKGLTRLGFEYLK